MSEDWEDEETLEEHRKKNSRRRSKVIAGGTTGAEVDAYTGLYSDPRCHCCTHESRMLIDKLCVTPHVSVREIGRMFGVSHQSVANHGKNHLNYNEASIRRIIEAEASALQENVEEGVQGILSRRVFLSSYIQRTMEALLSGELPLSGKEAMAAINMLTQYEESEVAGQMQELQDQFDAFQKAMKEIVPSEQWYAIIERTKEIYQATGLMSTLRQIQSSNEPSDSQ